MVRLGFLITPLFPCYTLYDECPLQKYKEYLNLASILGRKMQKGIKKGATAP